jgi:phospholipid/cholesterol/gamma-HCH transport system substrate-binding protein
VSVLLAIGALLTFVFLNNRFEGPDPIRFLGSPYELTARFDNTKTLPSKQAVLHKGVSVGRVRSVDWDPEEGTGVVTFTLTEEVTPIYADAKLQIGERSLLGDPYLNLIDRGSEVAGELRAGDELAGRRNIVAPVNFDEALDFLDAEGRAHARSLIDSVAEGVGPRGNGERLNGTVAGLGRTIRELHLLTANLSGQEEQIATLVEDSATVLGELGSREQAVREIVSSGRLTLDALGASADSLERALTELPPLLEAGRSTLVQLRPLIAEARPLLRRVRELAPVLTPALEEGAPFSIGPLSRDLIAIIEGLPDQRRASEALMPRMSELNRELLPLVEGTTPAARNAVPIAEYLADRADSVAAFYGLLAGVVARGDDVGRYGRFGLSIEPTVTGDAPSDAYEPSGGCSTSVRLCWNAFPKPGDAHDHAPFSGPYPRLMPFEPPSRRSVLGE